MAIDEDAVRVDMASPERMITMNTSDPVTRDHRPIRVAECFGSTTSANGVMAVWVLLVAAAAIGLLLL
ncbi:hypothetical protein NWFMUON74_51240 [Nocardia wallacei]|uniref:Uncharacterized protein n=1 Tax=Nocardia wallacei TaxID=480035 RepID=A0A7G1KQA7_9NOCA|nr:hypothetical protein NWFMUON74_51240 [Nocardia wallacei]